MIVRRTGITATRDGLTVKQRRTFRQYVVERGGGEYHHGSCVGGDADAHAILRDVAKKVPMLVRIVLHMPDNPRHVAQCDGDEVRDPLPYLMRNHNIVDETRLLIGLPNGMREQLRSGTWATLRYARKMGHPLLIIFPDGSISRTF